jgi:hypothetical protein
MNVFGTVFGVVFGDVFSTSVPPFVVYSQAVNIQCVKLEIINTYLVV